MDSIYFQDILSNDSVLHSVRMDLVKVLSRVHALYLANEDIGLTPVECITVLNEVLVEWERQDDDDDE